MARGVVLRPLLTLLLLRGARAALGSAPLDYSPDHLRKCIANRHGGLTLVLENVRKENAALIARTAECLGIGSLHLIYTPDMDFNTRSFGALSPAAKTATLSKISRSATDWVSLSFHDSVASCLASLTEQKVDELVATTPPSSEKGGRDVIDLFDCDSSAGGDWALRRCALLFGSEMDGLSDELLTHATTRVTIAQRGQTQSLNVAACASIMLGEVTRRRRAAGCEPRLSEDERRRMERELIPAEGDGEAQAQELRTRAAIRHEMRRRKRAPRDDATFVDELNST